MSEEEVKMATHTNTVGIDTVEAMAGIIRRCYLLRGFGSIITKKYTIEEQAGTDYNWIVSKSRKQDIEKDDAIGYIAIAVIRNPSGGYFLDVTLSKNGSYHDPPPIEGYQVKNNFIRISIPNVVALVNSHLCNNIVKCISKHYQTIQQTSED